MRTLFVKTIILILLSLVVQPHAFADDPQELFNSAGEAYTQGDFSGAAALYEEYTEKYGYSANVLYNLGNSYANSGQPGLAILAYERALRLSPGNSDILSNMQTVQESSGLFERERTLSEHIFDTLSLSQWSLTALSALGFLTVTLLFSLVKNVTPRMMRGITACSLLTITISGYGMYVCYGNWTGNIVIAPENRLMISPFEGAASAGDIRPGRKVTVLDRHGTFVYVEDDSKRKGWLPENVIEPIVPNSR